MNYIFTISIMIIAFLAGYYIKHSNNKPLKKSERIINGLALSLPVTGVFYVFITNDFPIISTIIFIITLLWLFGSLSGKEDLKIEGYISFADSAKNQQVEPNQKENDKPKPITSKIPDIPSPRKRIPQEQEKIQFWYTDAEGNLTLRNVDVKKVDGEYLEAFCHDKQDMRTFRVERMDNEIVDLATGELLSKTKWLESHHIYKVIKQKTYYSSKYNDDYDDDFGLEICFTGFKKADKERLEELAELNDYTVRKSVTTNLSYLVCGSNAGPAKMAQAKAKGAEIISEEDFLEMIGED